MGQTTDISESAQGGGGGGNSSRLVASLLGIDLQDIAANPHGHGNTLGEIFKQK